MYKEMIFRLPGRSFFPDTARKAVARVCEGMPVDPALFNRSSDGKTLQGRYGDDRRGEGFGAPPMIVFDGGREYIRLYGIGAAGAALLDRSAVTLFSALSKNFGAIGFETREGRCELKNEGGHMIAYGLRNLVVAKKPEQCQRFIKRPIEEVAEDIKKLILRGLIGQARFLDMAAVGSSNHFEAMLPHDAAFALDVLQGEPLPIEIKPGILAAGYKNIVVAMPLDLKGPWFVGHLRSRGYGMIRRLNPMREAAC